MGLASVLSGCGDKPPPGPALDTDWVPYEPSSSGEQGGPGGRGSAVIDPCLGPHCERPNWEGREGIVDPLTDLDVTPLQDRHPAASAVQLAAENAAVSPR